jgi:hypothetical protein
MTNPIAANYANNNARTEGDMKQVFEDVINLLKEQPGGISKTSKTLSSDSFAVDNGGSYYVMTGQGGLADDLVTVTGGVNGHHIIVRSADAAQIITLKHGTGANKVRTKNALDIPLKDGMYAMLRFDSALGAGEWETLYVYYATQLADERSAMGLGTASTANTGTGATDVPTITNADGRYAKLAGLSTQTFDCATPTQAQHATRKDYVDTAVASAGGGAIAGICQFRLSTESGVPVSSSDRTAQSTIYLTPMYGNAIGLKISGTWTMKTTAEISLALSGLTSGKNYDVWAYWTGSVVALEVLVWSDDLNRATALARDNGAWVKSGDATRLYVGTIRTTGTTTTEDSAAKRFVVNIFNRELVQCRATTPTGGHTYGTESWRAWNNSTTVGETRVEFLIPVAGGMTDLFANGTARNITSSKVRIGIGVDQTTANDGVSGGADNSNVIALISSHKAILAAGYHNATILEFGQAAAPTFEGTSASNGYATSLLANIWR